MDINGNGNGDGQVAYEAPANGVPVTADALPSLQSLTENGSISAGMSELAIWVTC